jgi:hypothetical protein
MDTSAETLDSDDTSAADSESVPTSPAGTLTAADKVVYAFYIAGAATALIGQVWAGVEHVPFPDDVPTWGRIGLVAAPVAVLELGGVATSAMADLRRRKGEDALSFRIMSGLTAVTAVGFNVVGHLNELYLAVGFGGLSAFAYTLWLAHSNARRRDALRGKGKLAKLPPVYPLWFRIRERKAYLLAREIAQEFDLGVWDSIREARDRLRTEARHSDIASAVEDLIRHEYKDARAARIAAASVDMDKLAAEVASRTDYEAWADVIGKSLKPGVHTKQTVAKKAVAKTTGSRRRPAK